MLLAFAQPLLAALERRDVGRKNVEPGDAAIAKKIRNVAGLRVALAAAGHDRQIEARLPARERLADVRLARRIGFSQDFAHAASLDFFGRHAEPIAIGRVRVAVGLPGIHVCDQRRRVVGDHSEPVRAFAERSRGFAAFAHQGVEVGGEIADLVAAWDRGLGNGARVVPAAADGLMQGDQRPEQRAHGKPSQRRKQQAQNQHQPDDLLLRVGERRIRLFHR